MTQQGWDGCVSWPNEIGERNKVQKHAEGHDFMATQPPESKKKHVGLGANKMRLVPLNEQSQ